jgi:hypothetical protein
MPFLENDYYLTRGNTKLIHGSNWKDTVYKYDASSFYNWEQDNLPLYDLEDRTEFNWEQHGYAGSTVDGIQLVVSSTGADTTSPYQVFDSVSGALNALPRTLRFPVIIEVATSGELGDIDIEDFEFSENGGLEIINRCFSKILAGSSTSEFSIAGSGTNVSSISHVSSLDLSNTIYDSSAVAVSAAIPSGNYATFNRAFVRMADVYRSDLDVQTGYGSAGNVPPGVDLRPTNITVGVKNADSTIYTAIANDFLINTIYPQEAFDYITTAPVGHGFRHPTNYGTGTASDNLNMNAASPTSKITGFLYANKATKIRIKNCNGKIYLRGFCVDGVPTADEVAPTSFGTDEGILVENSNVVIENCAVMRCNKAGAKFVNSQVVLNRGFTANRNYRLASDNTVSSNAAYGILAYDSDITLSGANDVSAGLGIDNPFTISHNHTGIQLNNSTLRTPWGGRGYDIVGNLVYNAINFRQIYLDVLLNTNTGIELNNSMLDMYHTLMVYQNAKGIEAKNSNLILDEIVCDHNSGIGLDADNSVIEYYRTIHGNVNAPNKPLSFLKNGQNIKLVNSTFKEPSFTNFKAQNVYNNFEIEGAGYTKINNNVVPAVVLDNSVCRLLAIKSSNGTSSVDAYATIGTPVLGSAYRADSNSYLKFMGVSGAGATSGATYITGPSSNYENKLNTVAVFGNNNSVVEFNGPAVFNNAGINVGVNNNSTINMLPHNENGVLQVTKYNLSDTDMHTQIVAQSYRSCFAANNNSTIVMKDCGDYIPYWNRSSDTYVTQDLILSSTYNPNDVEGISQYVSGGYIQFFPNPILDNALSTIPFSPSVDSLALSSIYPVLDSSNAPDLAGGVGDAAYYNYSQGGYCVRADKGSEVKVKNVHFPCGFLNPSSTILDVSAGLSSTSCGKIFIWGIGQDSRLHASHIVVSGHYPEDVAYNGPSGVYVSAAECDGLYTVLSAAPSATPSTGRLSILDSFGMQPAYVAGELPGGVSAMNAVLTPQNKGPFRIYFSVDPMAKFLGYTRGANATYEGLYQSSSNLDAGYVWDTANNPSPSAVEVGEPYQELAQGYNPSRDCSAPALPRYSGPALSSIYQELAFQNTLYQPLSTTFFYASGMLDDSYTNRVWLDDSAMNTFANAKNATKGTSGRPKLVSYYKATYNRFGAGYGGSGAVGAGGFRQDYGLGFKSSNIFDFEDNV